MHSFPYLEPICCFISGSARINTKKKKNVLFTIGNWNAKEGSQEIPVITGKFGLGV